MVLSWTKGRVFRRGRKGIKELNSGGDLEVEVAMPTHFRCPVTLDLMKDPVTLSTGITYDRDSIEKWFEAGNHTCPVTKRDLASFDMIPNHALRRMIQDWCVEHRSFGVERIPTPRIPVTPYEVSDTCTRIMLASQNGDENRCRELVHKIKAWGKESERNKRCIVANGAPLVLASAFDSFSRGSVEKNVVVLEEILGVLTWMRPIGEEGRSMLGSAPSMSCMVWFLNGKQISARQNAALLLKEMPIEALAKTEGVVEGLVNMIREPIGPSVTKSCLLMIFHLVSSSENKDLISQRFVELGLASLVLEAIVDAERGICEKGLGVLDCICERKQGMEIAKSNALILPLVIKKLLRVSELSSTFAVSILWKLCDKTDERILIEALQVGAFQKLLVLLQVGCGEDTKEKATELLRLLNGYRSKADCVDSSLDFKHLKKPF
ncbi:U-box domain-containing protein 21-like [Gastrolobium bilobum]|uniref:U-box domain-containing protein 21-like n=1 Tax=Gastrolobium bilobum TaxID=150636 RepID=UPI002AB15112|nr:U-box domain-containing protein 21-like [Gastrolobium bilobum]